MKPHWLLALAPTLLALDAAPARAQADAETPSVETSVIQGEVIPYLPEFFAPYSPLTASDMISRIPGFDLDTGDTARGLSGAVGNVLIDGVRPPGKSDVRDMLSRLRANQVARIDLIRGGAPGIDMQGKLQVINIIRAPRTGGYSGTFEAGTVYVPTADRADGSLDVLGVRELANQTRFEGQLSYNRAAGESGAPGTSRLRVDRTGAVINRVSNQSDDSRQSLSGRASADFKPFGGEAKLTGRASRFESNQQATELFDGTPRLTDSDSEETSRDVEATYAHALGLGRMQAVVSRNWYEEAGNTRSLSGRPPTGYGNVEDSGKIDANVEYPLGAGLRLQSVFAKSWREQTSSSSAIRSGGTLSIETNQRETGETALRTTLFYKASDVLSFETGSAAAYNFLEGSSDINLGGVSQVLPGSQAEVNEKRGEVFLVGTWRLHPVLTLEGAIRREFSTLTATGVRKELAFNKPMLRATWDIRPRQQLIARVERTVGQLDFTDFLASASISEFDEYITAGAVDLTPTQTWTSSLRFDQRFWETGTLRLSVDYRVLTDVIDTKPIPTRTGSVEGTGNIGGGRKSFFNAEFDTPLDRLGIAGARLSMNGQFLLLSEVTDPFTQEKRRFAGDIDYRLRADFEHDIRSWKSTWGFSASTATPRNSYRSNSIEVSEQGPDFSAYAIYRPTKESLFRLDLRTIVPYRLESRRQVHTGRRDLTPVSYVETRINERVRSIRLTYRRTVG